MALIVVKRLFAFCCFSLFAYFLVSPLSRSIVSRRSTANANSVCVCVCDHRKTIKTTCLPPKPYKSIEKKGRKRENTQPSPRTLAAAVCPFTDRCLFVCLFFISTCASLEEKKKKKNNTAKLLSL